MKLSLRLETNLLPLTDPPPGSNVGDLLIPKNEVIVDDKPPSDEDVDLNDLDDLEELDEIPLLNGLILGQFEKV